MASLAKGQLSTVLVKDLTSFSQTITHEGLKYEFSVTKSGPETFALTVNGATVTAKVREQPDGSLLASFGGATRKIHGMEEPLGLRIICDGVTSRRGARDARREKGTHRPPIGASCRRSSTPRSCGPT